MDGEPFHQKDQPGGMRPKEWLDEGAHVWRPLSDVRNKFPGIGEEVGRELEERLEGERLHPRKRAIQTKSRGIETVAFHWLFFYPIDEGKRSDECVVCVYPSLHRPRRARGSTRGGGEEAKS